MPRISVVIPCYNVAPLVEQSIRSALNQSHPPAEIILVDDGSKDDTPAVIQRFIDAHDQRLPTRIVLIRQKNAGVSRARNVGIVKAGGDFIAFLDGDDLFMPSKLEKQLALLEAHPEACGVFCGLFQFMDDLDDMERAPIQNVAPDPDVRHILLHQTVVVSTVMVRRTMLHELHFDETTGHGEDTVFAAALRLRGPWRMVNEPLVAKRTRPGQASALTRHAIWNTRTRVEFCRQHAAEIGPQTARDIEDDLWRRIVSALERRYWRRELRELPAMRDQLAKLCPEHLSQSFLARTRLYPRWVYHLKDRIVGRPPTADR